MIVFIRHAESLMNLPGEHVEDAGAPLTEAGKNQAKSFFQKRPFLKDFISSHAVICSTATRCIQTAEFLGLKNFNLNENLLEGSKYNWLKYGGNKTFLEYNWAIYKCRLKDFSENNISVIAHGGIINYLIFKFLGFENYPGYEFIINHCAAVIIKNNSIEFL